MMGLIERSSFGWKGFVRLGISSFGRRMILSLDGSTCEISYSLFSGFT
jgi:hypothetical protein